VERAEPDEMGADPSEGEVIRRGDLLNGVGALERIQLLRREPLRSTRGVVAPRQ
jgi:hypothetical protein